MEALSETKRQLGHKLAKIGGKISQLQRLRKQERQLYELKIEKLVVGHSANKEKIRQLES